ncbi:hypothetical protein R1sor_019066 [Riccia sorocarpa]|uniref:Protein kinase domain-containing protein n=1 Tax=Riccia sorocarpa TaxID=122646 RepID=A0ABD3IHP3_9MARC
MASRGHGAAGGRDNRERDDKGKRPMVDPDPIREPVEETDDKSKRPMVIPDPICEPVEETLEEGELAPIIIGQPTTPSTQVEAGEGRSVGQKKKKKKTVSKESHEASRARSEVNHHIRHAWFKWFVENAEHRNTFKLYNTPGTNMGVRRLVEHLSELESVPYKLIDEYKIWIKTKVFKDWSDASYKRMRASHIAGRLATDEGKAWSSRHRMPTWEDERSLVFAALGDLGMTQQVHVAASVNGRKYPRVPKKERDWIAPELVDSKIQKLAARNIHIHPVYEYNKATDLYALGVLTLQVCRDFFTDMTMPERIAYNKKYYALGAPKDTDPAGQNEILLKDLIQSATHHHAHMRTSAAQYFEVMSDNMKINPMTCSRPT